MSRFTKYIYVCLFIGFDCLASASIKYQSIEWPELMPDEDLAAIEAMPAIDHGDENSFNIDESWQEDDWDSNPDEANGDNISAIVANAVSNAMTIRDQPDVARAYDAALVSTKVRPEFDSANIRLAGFVVPLEFDDEQVIREFLLVPYFGACIHLPPPPPNQIIHVTLDAEKMSKGFNLQQLYEPVWVSGQLKTQLLKSSLATSAYSMSAHEVTPYTGE